MDVTQVGLRWIVAVAGLLVLASYVAGILRADDPEALWGGIAGNLRKAIVPFMFLAAAGFLAAAYLLLWKWTPDQLASLHWPGGTADGNGAQRVLVAYLLYLVPSALWLESTLLHLRMGTGATQALTIGVLTLVSVGLLMLGLLGWSAMQAELPGAGWVVAGVVAMAIQSTFWDNIVWVLRFPW